MNIHARFPPTVNDYINKLSCWYKEQINYLSGPVGSDQIHSISIANRVEPDPAALRRAARCWSALFVKALKGVSMR